MRIQKSHGTSLLLTFFFGPLGLFYSSIIAAVVMLAVTVSGFLFIWNGATEPALTDASGTAETAGVIVGSALWMWVVWAVVWIACIVIGIMTVSSNNRKVMKMQNLSDEARHQEQLAAIKSGQ